MFIAASVLRVSLLLLLALAAAWTLRARSASLRRHVLATAICSALAVPLLAAIVPTWGFALPTRPPAAISTVANTAGTTAVVTTFSAVPARDITAAPDARARASQRVPSPAALAAIAWMLGAVTGLGVLAAGIIRLASLSRRATRVRDGAWWEVWQEMAAGNPELARVSILQTTHPSLLVVWGWRHPRVLLPLGAGSWSRSRIRVVLAHEAEHVHRRDWLLQLTAEAVRALHWFNPLAWVAADRLRLESERACDDAVLARGIAAPEYAEQLVDLARTLVRARMSVPAPAMARASSLERRVSAMLDHQVARRPLTRFARFATVTIGLALTASIAGFAAQSPFATISGVVRDQLGGTVPKVTLTLKQLPGGARHEVTSNERGTFEFVGVPAGNYTLTASSPGFKTADTPMQIAAGQTITHDVPLELGTLQETIMVRDGAVPPASAPQRRSLSPYATSGCTAQPNSGGIKQPLKIADRRPDYPVSLRGTGVEGKVELTAVIGIDGTVKTMQTTDATNPEFEDAAKEAVRQWRFTPTLLNCVPVEVQMTVLTAFR